MMKALVLLCLLLTVVIASTEYLSVTDPRPVARAAEMLEQRYSWIVTYEDPVYAYDGDLVDVTEKVSRDPKKTMRVLIPRGGDLTFEYSIDSATKNDSSVVIQKLLDAHSASGNAGVFRMERNGERVHIIGIASRDKIGVVTPHQPVLDTLITIPAKKRNGVELLTVLCSAMSEASGTPVVIGQVPVNQLLRYETESGAKNQKARELLSNELDRMTNGARLSWRLLYDPCWNTYYLNIHPVQWRTTPQILSDTKHSELIISEKG